MNDLQKLLKLRGITIRDLAAERHVSYHSLQKFIKGKRKTPAMREAIASYLGVRPELLLGSKRRSVLRLLIENEIGRQTQNVREELQRKYLETRAA